ncbi:MAG: sigma-70 family RNA polymerase sigma factor [Gemmataceae bacterium]|nr:sigma-70 family RNA polymerase sigma factor [Gemmataceae bacterium]
MPQTKPLTLEEVVLALNEYSELKADPSPAARKRLGEIEKLVAESDALLLLLTVHLARRMRVRCRLRKKDGAPLSRPLTVVSYTQRVWDKFLRRLHAAKPLKFDGSEHLVKYLKTIANRLRKSAWAKEARWRQEVAAAEALGGAPGRELEPGKAIEENEEHDALVARLEACVAALPPDDQVLVNGLRAGKSYAALAEELGVSKTTIHDRFSRIAKEVRRRYKKGGRDGE